MQRLLSRFRRSVIDFLTLPVLIVLAFVVLAEVVDWFDNHAGPRGTWGPLRVWLSQYVGDTQSAIGVLTAIAGSLFTVTSVTFSILLLAVQQGATVLNSQIVDHYLRRRSNRAWFGFFVGGSVFVLITLVQTTHTKAPVFGVTVSTLLGAATLTALVVLIYATVDQTRPTTVMHSIAESALVARSRQIELLRQTAPLPAAGVHEGERIVAPRSGYLLGIDITRLSSALAQQPLSRLSFVNTIGDYVPEGAAVAYLTSSAPGGELSSQVVETITLGDHRDIATDASCSLDHLATIGWTAISTAHSDPAGGGIAIHSLQRLLHAWSEPEERKPVSAAQVFYEDRLPQQVMSALENLVVAATESRQEQTLALLFQAFTSSLPVLSTEQQRRIVAMVPTAALALREHLPTHALQTSTAAFIDALQEHGAGAEAELLRHARGQMRRSRE